MTDQETDRRTFLRPDGGFVDLRAHGLSFSPSRLGNVVATLPLAGGDELRVIGTTELEAEMLLVRSLADYLSE